MLRYHMLRKCKICIKNFNIFVTLRNTKTSGEIWKSLPITTNVNTWGDEIYFFVPTEAPVEKDSKDIIDFGEIAYWSSGKAIAIGFGKTPASIKDEIRLADKCNIWGDTDFDLKKLKIISQGEKISIERCS